MLNRAGNIQCATDVCAFQTTWVHHTPCRSVTTLAHLLSLTYHTLSVSETSPSKQLDPDCMIVNRVQLQVSAYQNL